MITTQRLNCLRFSDTRAEDAGGAVPLRIVLWHAPHEGVLRQAARSPERQKVALDDINVGVNPTAPGVEGKTVSTLDADGFDLLDSLEH